MPRDQGYIINHHQSLYKNSLTRNKTQRRRLEKAAVRIQSKWRAYQDLRRYRHDFRKDWDRKMGDLEKLVVMLETRGLSFVPPSSTVYELLREFNFFDTSNRLSSTKYSHDFHRVRRMSHLVLKSMMSSVQNQNILAFEPQNSWKIQARNFVLRLCPALLHLDESTKDLEDTIINVLNIMFDEKRWPESMCENANEILQSCVMSRERSEWTLFKVVREFLDRDVVKRNHRVESVFVSLCRKLILQKSDHENIIASAFSNTVLTARHATKPLNSPFGIMLTSDLFGTTTWSLCIESMLISEDLNTIAGLLCTLTRLLEYSVHHKKKKRSKRARVMRTNKDVRCVVSMLSKILPLLPVYLYRSNQVETQEEQKEKMDVDEDDDEDDDDRTSRKSLDTELPSLESREIPDSWGRCCIKMKMIATRHRDIQDSINILLDRTLVSRLCSYFDPANDLDEPYPVDFVSQLYYRLHTLCGGRLGRSEAELLIPKSSTKDGFTTPPKYLLPHVFNAVAFERSAVSNNPIFASMWRHIFVASSFQNKTHHKDPDVLVWCGINDTKKKSDNTDTIERRCSTLWFASLAYVYFLSLFIFSLPLSLSLSYTHIYIYIHERRYSQVLVTMDDTEFHSDKKRLEEVCVIVRTLRRILHRLIWQDRDISNLSFVQQDILRVASRLFNQIHVRNSRRHFCDEENWLWPALPKTELVPAALESAGTFDSTSSSSRRARIVLSCIPQVVCFDRRAEVFFTVLSKDRDSRSGARQPGRGLGIRIRRDWIFEDSLRAFTGIASSSRQGRGGSLKDRFQVEFIDENGRPEPGIDGGGVFKEYMDTLARRAFDPQFGLFKETDQRHLYPNPSSVSSSSKHISHFEFLGRVLGKAMYEGILIEPRFALHFLNKLLGNQNHFDEMRSLDEEVYKNLLFVKEYEGDFEDLNLCFEVTTSETLGTCVCVCVWFEYMFSVLFFFFCSLTHLLTYLLTYLLTHSLTGTAKSIPLVRNGSSIPVTRQNRMEYILRLAHYKLNRESATQSRAFLRGLREIVPERWLRMFDPRELQRLIGGSSLRIDVRDMRAHCRLVGGYEDGARHVIEWFWQVLESFTDNERAQLLMFVTSCSRPPLLGFAHLNPPFTIQRINISRDEDKLPTSATCINLLKLPTYSSREVLRKKLLLGMYETKGFELT